MSSTAGIGGGSGVVSILFIFFRFTTKEALGLSNCFVFITGIIKFCVSLKTKHPTIKHRPVNEYNLILILMPSMLLGSFFGATVSAMIPGILQRGGMVVVLIYAVFESLCKGIEIYKKESKEKAEAEAAKKAAKAVEVKAGTEDQDLESKERSVAEDEITRPKATKFLVMSTGRADTDTKRPMIPRGNEEIKDLDFDEVGRSRAKEEFKSNDQEMLTLNGSKKETEKSENPKEESPEQEAKV